VLPVGPKTQARRSESEHAMAKPIYHRVIVKISGEALAGRTGGQAGEAGDLGIHEATLARIAADLAATRALGVTLGIVVGGGNFMRGATAATNGLPRVTGDMMGMLATVMNALALEAALEAVKVPARTMSALAMPSICETYERRRAARHLEAGRVLLLAAGTGNPFFTTDTTAVLRAAELGAQAVLKATDVDGVYSADPKKDRRAKRYERLTHDEALARDLKVMDATAFALARENRMPIIVFSIREKGAIRAALRGEGRSTVVGS
jgi:uridylate kinase